MKKFALIFAIVILCAVSAFSQRVVMASYTDTLTDSSTKYYHAAVTPELVSASFQVWIDHLTGTGDSTYVFIQGSADNAIWINLSSSVYTSTITVTSAAPTDFKTCRFADADGGMIWNIASQLTLPYYRYKVIHYGTGTVRVKACMYKKK